MFLPYRAVVACTFDAKLVPPDGFQPTLNWLVNEPHVDGVNERVRGNHGNESHHGPTKGLTTTQFPLLPCFFPTGHQVAMPLVSPFRAEPKSASPLGLELPIVPLRDPCTMSVFASTQQFN
jgi:hypothetical protein